MKSMPVLPTYLSASTLAKEQKRNDRRLSLSMSILVFIATPLLVYIGIQIGFSYLLGGLAVLAIIGSISTWPVAGFFVIVVCTLLIEQDPLTINGVPAYYVYIFYWPPRLAGMVERPIGFLILFIFFVLICHRFVRRERLLYGGGLFWPFLIFMLCVAYGVVHGIISGGNFKIIVLEVRPFEYMFLAYLLAYNLVGSKKHIRLFFWLVIICAGIKSLQGVYIYAIALHGDLADNHQIMAHEESFFFVALLLLIILFSIHYRYRAQLYTALAIMPFTVIATVANQRRADYVALLVGVAVAWILVFVVKPKARKGLVIGMVVFLILGSAYVAAFYKSTGSLGEPAHAVVSVFHPDPTEAASNLYRYIEDYDLKFTVRQYPMGMGFGKEFLQPIPLPNILVLDPYYLYIPHNTIYWVWMRLGPIGYAAFWYLIGSIIVYGCMIARRLKDQYLQMVAIFIVSVIFMEVVVAYADYQLFFYRNVIYIGILVGILMRLLAIEKKESTPEHEDTRSSAQLTLSHGRS